ncbi:DUF2147 domain-containing protein [Acinetobacter lactucae]|uniref:DUF2147 domain-containing protein n=1 Tax=Acinetobacter lactucae TaxID=1785128 RepID=A0AB35K2Q0_9GAMM|nr:DUF2147 domain-containing protein [Acinetobacter lactucae]MDD9316545.1 DUF2147 domain-containing protein [Acinetobacter lactucae]MDD9320631.1 DUF2147 domain-containing protein [Acinetobacter lactucae]
MKKYLLLILLSFYSVQSFASDKLHGSVWKTIDDATNQPRALVRFSQDKNGNLSANIEKILVPSEANKCTMCESTYKNKSLIGLTIVKNLKNVGQNKYDKGSILDPQSDKTYRFSVIVSPSGEKLTARGYIGISAIGRNQTWYRVK